MGLFLCGAQLFAWDDIDLRKETADDFFEEYITPAYIWQLRQEFWVMNDMAEVRDFCQQFIEDERKKAMEAEFKELQRKTNLNGDKAAYMKYPSYKKLSQRLNNAYAAGQYARPKAINNQRLYKVFQKIYKKAARYMTHSMGYLDDDDPTQMNMFDAAANF